MESMEDFKEELEASFRQIKEGDVMTGTVIGISETEVTLDLKYYTDGIIRLEDLSNDPSFSIKEDVHMGDEITATVIAKDDGAGHILLSKKEANDLLSWDKLEEYKEKQSVLHTVVKGVVNGGVIVYVEGIRGFVPASKLSLSYVEDLNPYLNQTLDVQVITVDKEHDKLVLSAKELLREAEEEKRKERVSNVEIGLVTTGTVESLQPYGAFVNIGHGLSGLVHISQICEKRIKHPSVVLNVGDEVTVKIIDIKDGKLSLSIKAATHQEATEVDDEEIVIPEAEDASTSLGSLFKNLKF